MALVHIDPVQPLKFTLWKQRQDETWTPLFFTHPQKRHLILDNLNGVSSYIHTLGEDDRCQLELTNMESWKPTTCKEHGWLSEMNAIYRQPECRAGEG